MNDQEARKNILQKFYEAYKEHGLHVLVDANSIRHSLGLDASQAQRSFDYLSAKGLIKPMTLGGGYSPTVELIDVIEQEAAGAQ